MGSATSSTPATDSRVDFSSLLPPPLLQQVMQAMRRRRYPTGGLIYAQGAPGRDMYRVLSGVVRLYYLREDGHEFVHTVYSAGDWFGLSSLIDGEPRPQMAQAQSDTVLEVLSLEAFDAFRARDPAFDRALMLLLIRDVRLLINRVNSAVLEPLTSRLAWRIVKAAQPIEDGTLVAKLSQSELAAMVDASRQRVNTILGEFEAEGLLTRNYGRIEIRNRALLARKITKP